MTDIGWFCIIRILMSRQARHLVEPAMFDYSVVLGLGAEEVLLARFERHGKMMSAGGVYAEPSSEVVWAWRHTQRDEAIVPSVIQPVMEREKPLATVINASVKHPVICLGKRTLDPGTMYVERYLCVLGGG